jgi:hypothetical protein
MAQPSAELYIPPEGLAFRLLGYLSQHVLYSRTHRKPEFGHHPVTDDYPDHYFTLVKGTGARQGLYAIKSKHTGYVLYSRTHRDPRVGHDSENGRYDDNWFKLEPGKGQYAKQFRLLCPYSDTVIFSRTAKEPEVWNHPSSDVYADHHFSFLFEDMQVDKIEYDLKLGKILTSTPKILANQTIVNDSDVDQTLTFEVAENETHTSSHEQTTGFSITVGTSFSAGIPFIGGADFKVEATASHSWTIGKSTSFSKTYTTSFPVKAGPHTTVTATSTVNKGDLEVPFTIYLSSKSAGIKVQTRGVWRGVSTWDIRHTISQKGK